MDLFRIATRIAEDVETGNPQKTYLKFSGPWGWMGFEIDGSVDPVLVDKCNEHMGEVGRSHIEKVKDKFPPNDSDGRWYSITSEKMSEALEKSAQGDSDAFVNVV